MFVIEHHRQQKIGFKNTFKFYYNRWFFLSDVTINVVAPKINSPPSQRKTDVDSPNKAIPSKTDQINLKKSSGSKKDSSPTNVF